jgi:Zn finger protein HypA/HybF involved in hydrogenase expression
MTTKVICDKCGHIEVLSDDEYRVQEAVKVMIGKVMYELCPKCYQEFLKIKDYYRNKELTDLKEWINR